MKNTSKLKLNLPEYSDVIDIQKLNDNFTILDTEVDSTAKASDLASHAGDKNNPHAVTKVQVGLGNVDNTADTDKPVSTAQAKAISDAVAAHCGDTGAHSDIRDAVSSALEAAEAAQAAAEGAAAETYDITILASGWVSDSTYSGYGFKYAHAITGVTVNSIADLYLTPVSVQAAGEAGMLSSPETVAGYVNFYSESKPASNLTGTLMISMEKPFETIIEGFDPTDYVSKSMVGAASGVAGLGSDGKVPAAQLPAMNYVTPDQMEDAIKAIPTPDVSGQISTHNTNASAHQDIRNLITAAQTAANEAKTAASAAQTAANNSAPADLITAGTTDLTAGTSTLASGKFYAVY